MINFNTPENLDGAVLIQELESAGIVVGVDEVGSKSPEIDGDGILWLKIEEKDKAKAAQIVSAHNG
jgi:hypothetical protein